MKPPNSRHRVLSRTSMQHLGHVLAITHTSSRLGKFQRKDAVCGRCGDFCYAETTNYAEPDLLLDYYFQVECSGRRGMIATVANTDRC